MRMQMMRKLRCLAWFPCLLAFLLLPGSVHAKEYACDVTIPATVQVSGDRIPSGEVYEVVMEAITKDAPVAENMTQKVLIIQYQETISIRSIRKAEALTGSPMIRRSIQ